MLIAWIYWSWNLRQKLLANNNGRMSSTAPLHRARAFCIAFKQITGVQEQAVAGSRSVISTSKPIFSFTNSSSFVPSARFQHQKAYQSTGVVCCAHCLAKHQKNEKSSPVFQQRELCTSSRSFRQRDSSTNSWRDQLELTLKQFAAEKHFRFAAKMLGGGRRRSLRLSSGTGRREPLADIDNNVTNETKNTINKNERPITVRKHFGSGWK